MSQKKQCPGGHVAGGERGSAEPRDLAALASLKSYLSRAWQPAEGEGEGVYPEDEYALAAHADDGDDVPF